MHDRPQGRGNDRLEHRHQPAHKRDHEDGVRQARQEHAEIEREPPEPRCDFGQRGQEVVNHPVQEGVGQRGGIDLVAHETDAAYRCRSGFQARKRGVDQPVGSKTRRLQQREHIARGFDASNGVHVAIGADHGAGHALHAPLHEAAHEAVTPAAQCVDAEIVEGRWDQVRLEIGSPRGVGRGVASPGQRLADDGVVDGGVAVGRKGGMRPLRQGVEVRCGGLCDVFGIDAAQLFLDAAEALIEAACHCPTILGDVGDVLLHDLLQRGVGCNLSSQACGQGALGLIDDLVETVARDVFPTGFVDGRGPFANPHLNVLHHLVDSGRLGVQSGDTDRRHGRGVILNLGRIKDGRR